MDITVIDTEEIEIDGLPYSKKTYSNGAVTTELNLTPEPDPEPEPEPEPEYISKSELDAAYSEGVNSIG